MGQKIDWYYHRKGCNTCAKMDALLEKHGLEAKETVNATKAKLGPDEALKVIRGAEQLLAARGKSLVEFDLKRDRPSDEELLKKLIGPTGTLRAPTIRSGKTVTVGYHETLLEKAGF